MSIFDYGVFSAVFFASFVIIFAVLFVYRLNTTLFHTSKRTFFKDVVQSDSDAANHADKCKQMLATANDEFVPAMKLIDAHLTISWRENEKGKSETTNELEDPMKHDDYESMSNLNLLLIQFDMEPKEIVRHLKAARNAFITVWRDRGRSVRFDYRLAALRLAFFADVYRNLLKRGDLRRLQLKQRYVAQLLPKIQKLRHAQLHSPLRSYLRRVRLENLKRLKNIAQTLGLTQLRFSTIKKLTRFAYRHGMLAMENFYHLQMVTNFFRLRTIKYVVRLLQDKFFRLTTDRRLRNFLTEILLLSVMKPKHLMQAALAYQDSVTDDRRIESLTKDEKKDVADSWLHDALFDDAPATQAAIASQLKETDKLIDSSEELLEQAIATKTDTTALAIFEAVVIFAILIPIWTTVWFIAKMIFI